MKFRYRNAFSLLEILIALGLFAVVISALLTLFPIALRTEKSSGDETMATLIASGMMESLPSSEGLGSLNVATRMSNDTPVWEVIPSDGATNIPVAYNASCEPVRRLTAKEAEAPLTDPAIAIVATLSLTKASVPGLLTAEVAVASPASAPAANRTVQKFTRLIQSPSR